jgi:hypothetical protein
MRSGTVAAFLSVLAFASAAGAQEDIEGTREPESSAPVAVGDGSFLPEALSAKVGTLQVYGYGSDGCDSSWGGPLIDSAVEARVPGPLALRFQATYSNDTDKMRPSIGGKLSAKSTCELLTLGG